MIGKPLSEAQAIIAQYDGKLPFVARSPRDLPGRGHRASATPSSTTAPAGIGIVRAAADLRQGRRTVLARGGAAPHRAIPSIPGLAAGSSVPTPTPRSMR